MQEERGRRSSFHRSGSTTGELQVWTYSRMLVRAASLAVLVLVLSAASCPPQRIAYNSIDEAVTVAQTAVKAFKDLRAQGKFTDADELKVREAYLKFQVSAEAARVLAQNASQKEAAMKQVNDATAQLLAIVTVFTGGK